MALGTALAIQAGSTALGGIANSLFNSEPDIPDLSAEAQTEFNERQRELDELVGRREKELEADLAASGRTGSAGASARRQVASEFAGAQADLASRGAQAVAEGEQREDRLRFQRDQRKRQQRAQAIGDLIGGVGQTLGAQALTDEGLSGLFGGEGTSGVDLSGGGGDGTLVDTPPGGFNGTDFVSQKFGVLG